MMQQAEGGYALSSTVMRLCAQFHGYEPSFNFFSADTSSALGSSSAFRLPGGDWPGCESAGAGVDEAEGSAGAAAGFFFFLTMPDRSLTCVGSQSPSHYT